MKGMGFRSVKEFFPSSSSSSGGGGSGGGQVPDMVASSSMLKMPGGSEVPVSNADAQPQGSTSSAPYTGIGVGSILGDTSLCTMSSEEETKNIVDTTPSRSYVFRRESTFTRVRDAHP